MSDPGEHGKEYPALMPKVEVTSGLVVSPGDVLVLAVGADTDRSDMDEFKRYLDGALPNVEVVVVGGNIHMAVMKPATLDVPARPLVKLPVDDVDYEARRYRTSDEVRLAVESETTGSVDEFLEHPGTGKVRTRPTRGYGGDRW